MSIPAGSIIGLAQACKWKLLGGAVALFSMAALFMLRPDLLDFYFLALSLPALLYVLSGWLEMRRAKRTGALGAITRRETPDILKHRAGISLPLNAKAPTKAGASQ